MEDKILNKVYEVSKQFAKNLKFERESKGLTQNRLAQMLGITPQSYNAYENGISMPTAENIIKIALMLEVSLSDLFEI